MTLKLSGRYRTELIRTHGSDRVRAAIRVLLGKPITFEGFWRPVEHSQRSRPPSLGAVGDHNDQPSVELESLFEIKGDGTVIIHIREPIKITVPEDGIMRLERCLIEPLSKEDLADEDIKAD